jgi:hypothetical protein
MVQVIEAAFDPSGSVVRSAALPVVFASRNQAVTFIRAYLKQHYALGRYGYRLDEDYWWGCPGDPGLELCRYRIDESGEESVSGRGCN